jgi:hypothetical protein
VTRKVRIEDMPHLVRPGMAPEQRDRAISQNFDHMSVQLRNIAKALHEDDLPLSDVEEAVAPENLHVVFHRRKQRRRIRYTAIVRFDGGPDEDITRAVVQSIYTDVNGDPVELDDDGEPVLHRKRVEVPDEDDARDRLKVVFRNLEKPRHWYVSFRARWKTKRGWFGDWSDWTEPLLPKDNVTQVGAGTVLNLTHKHPAVGRHVWLWDEPDVEDVNVDRYKVVVQRRIGPGNYATVEQAFTRATRYAYHVPKANRGTRHRARVTVVDEDGNEAASVDGADEDDNETLPGTDIEDGTLDLTPFASSIRPVALVTSLPTLPNASYPIGSFVYHTGTLRLHENKSNVWVDAISAGNLSGQIAAGQIVANSITAGQIAAGAISTSELAAEAVTAEKLAATAVFAKLIATDSVGSYIVIDGVSGKDQVQFWSGGSSTVLTATNGGVRIGGSVSAKVSFFGATPMARPTVTGSRDGNAALNSLLGALEDLGLIGDNTTAS